MEAYLDNSATTSITESVRDKVIKALYEDYGNPSSLHRLGVAAEAYIKEAALALAGSLKVEPREIVFTSGGTESNNLAIMGAAYANRRRGRHIISTAIEHPSVHEPLMHLKDNGFDISLAPVDGAGRLKKEELYNLIREETILVSIMYVNNEVGSVQDIAEISSRIKERYSDIIIHTDAVQAFGKYRIYPKRDGIDLLTLSGHKIHAPKGSGALYIADRVKVNPIMFGGGHQRGFRSGTENVPAIAGLGQAVKELYTDFEEKISRMYKLKLMMLNGLAGVDGVTANGLPGDYGARDGGYSMELVKKTAPHIISLTFDGVKSEVFLHALEDKGVYVSSGSACSSHHSEPSATLTAMGFSKEKMDSTLRISLSDRTTEKEIEYALEQISNLYPVLKRYTRK